MTDESVLWRSLPLVSVLGFLGLGLGWRSWLQVRRYGASGFALFRSRSLLRAVRDALLIPFTLLLVAAAAMPLVAPASPGAFGPLPGIGPAYRSIGAVLSFGALALMLVAQVQLGASWRVGIDEQARPGLVTSGMYRVCRNPIYAWWFLWLIGFLLLVPTWISLAAVLLWSVGIGRAVREEEAYLLGAYGEQYRAYARRVGRFLPWLGRLRSS